MKKTELQSIIREEVKKVLTEDYIKQMNLYVDEFDKLSPQDYKKLSTLVQQFDKMQDANDDLFTFTGDFVDSKTFEDAWNWHNFYSTVADEAKSEFPKAAKIASEIAKILEKIA